MSYKSFRKSNIYFRLCLVIFLLFFFNGLAQAQIVFPYGESFKNATAAGIIVGFGGTSNPAVLTGTGTAIDGITDPLGAGYLRLTSQLANQSGFARSTKKFPSRYGVTVNFDYYIWNSANPQPTYTADGLSFFMFDATALPFNIGGFGGSLGYAQRNTPSVIPGISKGFLGVGLDEFGNFATRSEGRQGGNGSNDALNRSNVSLRGDGNGSSDTDPTNYEYLTHTRTTGEDGAIDGGAFPVHGNVNGRTVVGGGGLTPLHTGFRRAKIEIIPVNLANIPDTINAPTRYKINVWITTGAPAGAVLHRVINDYYYTPTSAVPDSLSYGFAASTGGYQNYHEVRGIDIVAPSVFEFKPILTDIAVTRNEDATYTFSTLDFTTAFLDPNGTTTLTEIRIETLPSNGILKLNGVAITTNQIISLANIPNITFVPNADWHGSASFNWNGKDATSYATISKAVNITINSVNDAPVGVNSEISVLNNAVDHVITAAKFGFSDPNDVTPGPANTFNGLKITTLPALGTLKLNNVAVNAGDDISLADITANKLTYTPVAAGSGSPYTTFTFQVRDNGGTTNGGVDLDQSPNTMTINVESAPTITLTAANPVICFGTASAGIVYSGTTGTPAKPNRFSIDFVDAAMTDVVDGIFDGTVGGTLSVTGLAAIVGGTYNGTLTVRNSGNGFVSAGVAVSVVINQTPQPSIVTGSATVCAGTIGVTYSVTSVANTTYSWTYSGTGATITAGATTNAITVTYADNATSGNWSVTATNNTTTCTSVARTFAVTVNLTLQPSIVTGTATVCAGTIGVTYSVTSVANTTYSWTYSGTGATITAGATTNAITVTYADNATSGIWSVTATNNTTTCTSVARAFAVTVTAKPVVAAITGANTTTVGATTQFTCAPAGGIWSSSNTSIATVSSTGIVTGVAVGTATITYSVTSSGCTASSAKVITVSAASAPNTPPIIADVSKTGSKDQPVPFLNNDFTSKFSDPNGDVLNKIKVVSLPGSGLLKLNGVDIIAGQEILATDLSKIIFTPPAGFIGGPISFQWNGSDGTDYATTSKNVNITITATNIPPVAVADNYTTSKGGTLTIAAPGVLSNDSDADGNPITAIKVTDPVNGTVTLNANGSFTYVHTNRATSSDSFTYKVNDGISDGNTVIVSITLINTPPIVSNLIKTGTGFGPIPFTVNDFTSKYTDSDSDPLVKVKIISLPPNGVLKLNGIPVIANQEIPVAELFKLTFEPALNWSGTTNFTWNGSDGAAYATNNANAALTVVLASDPNAKLGLAKNLASVTSGLNGTYDIKFVFTAVNYGINALENVSIRDNLALAFGGTEVVVKSVTAFGNLKANTSYNGSTSLDLLLGSSSLSADEEAKVELLINVKLGLTGGTYQNTATADGISSITGLKVTDVSTNGLKPDPINAGDISPSVSTPIQLDAPPAFVPAGFSPNGDGTNDKFIIQNTQGKQVSLEVFNRWGNSVYKSVDYKNDWGGEVTQGFFIGRDIPDGTYYYIIIIGNKDKYAGFITINR